MTSKNNLRIKKPFKLTLGCSLLVISGTIFGIFEAMKNFIRVDKSFLWIPAIALICMFVGITIILYREEQLR